MTDTAARPTFDTTFFRRIASLSGWEIARLYGLHYEGDTNAIDHGGTFYSLTNWKQYGYASCVELCSTEDRSGGAELLVTPGIVHMPDADTLRKALAYCDRPDADDTASIVDAVKSYCGAEPDGHEPGRTYNMDNWPNEWRLWKSIHPLLLALSQE